MTNPGDASRIVPWRGMLLYLVLGVAWVFVGDELLARWVSDPVLLTRFQTWKGWGYVLLTSCLAWCMLRSMRRAEKVRVAMARSCRRSCATYRRASRVWRQTGDFCGPIAACVICWVRR